MPSWLINILVGVAQTAVPALITGIVASGVIPQNAWTWVAAVGATLVSAAHSGATTTVVTPPAA
jgi:hypothetical protein